MFRFSLAAGAFALMVSVSPLAVQAQDRDQTLADIRQEMSVLYVEVQRLKRELSTTGTPSANVGGNSPLERIDAMEAVLQRLTARTEEMEYKINQIATVGGNQIGDLEFRLCELETNCDLGNLSEGTTLGNIDVASAPSVVLTPTRNDGLELAVGEKADFEAAQASVDGGDYATAAQQLGVFVQNYPGSPLSAQAYFLQGDAYEKLGETRPAARAYLDSFSSAPDGDMAPQALFKVGATLRDLGQNTEACQMFDQVGVRFPNSTVTSEAQSARQNMGCL
ncbi:tol-pal system protein YbgF [Halocynthiibacter sp.]|uniref:tol-pal system protein YbgF n=1 Tax=Halocynthiibacter sp. TaxID=1979210 RepID=UPI003C427F8C